MKHSTSTLVLLLAALSGAPLHAAAQTSAAEPPAPSAGVPTPDGAPAPDAAPPEAPPAPAPTATEVAPTPALLSAATPAHDVEAAAVEPPRFLISARGGVFLPQVFNRLDTSFTAGLGFGIVLPFLDHRIAVVADGFYTRPERTQTLSDPRLTSGSYSYTLVQNDVSLFAGAIVHFTDLARDLVVPYAGLGARVHFTWSEIDGVGGAEPLGAHRETSTQGGGAVRAGVGIRVGPGLVALDAELSLAPLDHLITGSANVGALAVSAGYTLVL